MKQYLMRGAAYPSASSCCPTRGVGLDWLLGKPLSARKTLCVVPIMISAVVTARG
jgi:hypothetical protein